MSEKKKNSRTEYASEPRRKRGKKSRRSAKKKNGRNRLLGFLRRLLIVACLLLIIRILIGFWPTVRDRLGILSSGTETEVSEETSGYTGEPRQTMEDWPNLDVELLDVNSYSRPGIKLKQVNGIVIHYTANPGSSAMQNRDYFANLETSHTTKASSHFIIGLEGEIIQCIPCSEMAYASNSRNSDTLAIECCIPDDTGAFNDATYDSLVELTAWLVCRYDLTTDDVIRHYDITGKNCPKYFVEHEDAWESFKSDVNDYIAKYS